MTEPTTRNISFTINDGVNPIEGASVKIGAETKTTGSAGGCTFSDMEEGTVSVEVSKEGYTTKTESITIDETHTAFTVTLVAVVSTGTVSVTCQDSESTPLENASVYLTTQADWDFDLQNLDLTKLAGLGTTESDGTCAVANNDDPNIAYGEYYLYGIDSNETIKYSGTLTVDGDEEVTITLITTGTELKPQEPGEG